MLGWRWRVAEPGGAWRRSYCRGEWRLSCRASLRVSAWAAAGSGSALETRSARAAPPPARAPPAKRPLLSRVRRSITRPEDEWGRSGSSRPRAVVAVALTSMSVKHWPHRRPASTPSASATAGCAAVGVCRAASTLCRIRVEAWIGPQLNGAFMLPRHAVTCREALGTPTQSQYLRRGGCVGRAFLYVSIAPLPR